MSQPKRPWWLHCNRCADVSAKSYYVTTSGCDHILCQACAKTSATKRKCGKCGEGPLRLANLMSGEYAYLLTPLHDLARKASDEIKAAVAAERFDGRSTEAKEKRIHRMKAQADEESNRIRKAYHSEEAMLRRLHEREKEEEHGRDDVGREIRRLERELKQTGLFSQSSNSSLHLQNEGSSSLFRPSSPEEPGSPINRHWRRLDSSVSPSGPASPTPSSIAGTEFYM